MEFKFNKWKDRRAFLELDSKAGINSESLTPEERRRLISYGDYLIYNEGYPYNAMCTFEVLDEFEKLNTLADVFRDNWPNAFDRTRVHSDLEDHETMRDLLNQGHPHLYWSFSLLSNHLHKYVERFLQENGTPVATGGINEDDEGMDLVAIRNLAKEYDIAVPIARGGLNQGAIAALWGMPTRTIDVSAHKRKVPKSKWVSPVESADFDGKRVLLFDKDAVTGATVREVLKKLTRYRIASIGIYFTHPVITSHIGLGTRIDGLPSGIKIHDIKNTPMTNAGDAYIEAHEKLGTIYGQRRLIKKLLMDETEKHQQQYPDIAEALTEYILKQMQVFDDLNPRLPGVSQIREHILNRLQVALTTLQGLKGILTISSSRSNYINILKSTQPLPDDFADHLVRARYLQKAHEAAKKRNVENLHMPSKLAAAFSAALEAVKNKYDVALIVGPEGFSYEPFFQDFGIPTVAVNIPEFRLGEPRTITIFDELSALRNKRVLVVEDDVRSGATLQKVLEHLEPHKPSHLGLYLGQPKNFQRLESVPSQFKDIHIASSDPDESGVSKDFIEFLNARGRRIFKTADKETEFKK